ncbi:hypothetical protein RchiOBHm_Chr5g0056781 [Rosa chinensis]|uniref:Uncharacterized protein n=1 Tax=Rosa chinensis TaxID=74649 RepID=A0A2P6QGQ8_ROSCH|nr:hypothetical protein RchiOBHm_Chr5g0056781 [Rosa chinensis]
MASGFLHLILGHQATLFGETYSLVSDFLHLVLGFLHLMLGFQAPFLGGTDGFMPGFLHFVLGFQAPCWDYLFFLDEGFKCVERSGSYVDSLTFQRVPRGMG